MSPLLKQLKLWLKHSSSPMARGMLTLYHAVNNPPPLLPKLLAKLLYQLVLSIKAIFNYLADRLFWTTVFSGRTSRLGRGFQLQGGMPLVVGPLDISIGDHCRINGHSTFSGRWVSEKTPCLKVGNNVDIGWLTTIAVGTEVSIGNNVRMAGRCFLAGYPGHPLDPLARAEGKPDLDEQCGSIRLDADVWLATGVMVMAGVHIGEGTVVAAGSVVTKDLPPHVLAAGSPAKVIRQLKQESSK